MRSHKNTTRLTNKERVSLMVNDWVRAGTSYEDLKRRALKMAQQASREAVERHKRRNGKDMLGDNQDGSL